MDRLSLCDLWRALGGLIHAIATIRFNIDQVISGVVMNLLAFFGVRYLSELVFVGQPQGGINDHPHNLQRYQKSMFHSLQVDLLVHRQHLTLLDGSKNEDGSLLPTLQA